MKKGFLSLSLLTLFFSFIAQASESPAPIDALILRGGEGGDIGDDFVAPGMFADFPGVPNLGNVSVAGACVESDGENLYGGITDVCVKWQSAGICGQKEKRELRAPIMQSQRVCAVPEQRGSCSQFKDEVVQVPLNYDIKIFPIGPRGIDRGHLLFTKPFTIRHCSQ